ncbi:cysteine desulfurase [Microbacterium sp. ru370.1]|uniref:cysteine desulfurase family protein n=1 Tax=unclassified Microbacterium TaxID=2609290 RepID=UPI000891DD7A|nr:MULTISPECIES: cysteine desulfurase family protein [unclassified Microbacterium]SDO80073.1 cysteine desulfurase [Microbacterium sp. ru370.1]SIT89570.1 cysteine desulfurase [Microbacterium sp. RU1D]
MRVYLDHAATTPLRAEAREAWLAAHEVLGNPSSIHGAGQDARRLLEDARDTLAGILGCQSIEVVLTSGGTEAANLALKGLWWSRAASTRAVVLPDGEHHATLDVVGWLAATQDADVRAVPLDGLGRIDAEAFAAALPGAALATALVASNEVGTIQDAAGLAAAASGAGIPLHLDAVSALGQIAVDFGAWRGNGAGSGGLVALSVSAHKVGGPVGVGAAVVSRHAAMTPLLHGGGQQRGLRAGTQDVAGAAAFAAAATAAEAERERESARLSALRDRLVSGILQSIPGARLLGAPDGRLPGNAHVLFPDAAGETLLFLLDMAGVAVSTGSACQAGVAEPSHVVLALGLDDRAARSVLRFTLGHTSTADDIEAVLARLPDAYARAVASGVSGARSASGARPAGRS